ncbi:MAG TPA: hypothetical protein VK929_05760 [Longimicrobiales bacterium]|nr:hypothetical protein [Longimicrobiales bacterium]
MRHVDEGILHAWLDGALDSVADAGGLPMGETVATVEAHLRTCAHCQALLERERIVRGEAGLILEDTARAPVDVPPFERIAAGVAGGAEAGALPARRSRRGLTLAWAASVLLAIGAGWWGSVVWQDGGGRSDGAIARDAAAAGTRDPTDAPSATVEEVAAAAPTGGGAPADGAGPMAAVDAAPATSPPAADVPAEPARIGERVAAAGAPQQASQAVSQPAPIPVAQAAPPPVALPMPLGEVAVATRDAVAAAQDPIVAVDPVVPGITTFAPLTLSSSAGREVPRPQAMLQAAPSAGRLAGRAAADAAGAVERTPLPMVTFRESIAAARNGMLRWWPAESGAAGDVLVLQGARVDGIDLAALPDGSVLTRVRHRLADGALVELLQWQDPDEPRARVAPVDGVASALFLNAGPTADGRHEVLLRAPALGAFIMISADMEADTLVRLADALVVSSR